MQRQSPGAEVPFLQLPHQLGDQPLERLRSGFVIGRRLFQAQVRARRRVGGRGGQRLGVAAERPVERLDDIFRASEPPRERKPRHVD